MRQKLDDRRRLPQILFERERQVAVRLRHRRRASARNSSSAPGNRLRHGQHLDMRRRGRLRRRPRL